MKKESIVASAFRDYRSKFSCSLAAALLDSLVEHPACHYPLVPEMRTIGFSRCHNSFSAGSHARLTYLLIFVNLDPSSVRLYISPF